jgi:DNA-binding beta-propeller fold protein YncE
MFIQRLFLPIFLCLTFALDAEGQNLLNNYQQFMEAYNQKDYNRCAQVGVALARSTNHPGIQYKLAECLCQSGQTDASLAMLELLAKRGLTYSIEENKGFSLLHNDTRFIKNVQAFKKNRTVIDKSIVSFVVNDSLLIPEGIAYDSQRKTFYIGSLAKNKVISCSGTGDCTNFATGLASGFWMALGMKVSPDQKSLWICSASERDSINGYAGIFQFEIPSGNLLRQFTVDNKNGPHLFNDIVFTPSGAIYFTDSKGGQVWQIAPGSDSLTTFAAGYIYPNGIAIDEANKLLFVADFTGLHKIDLETGKSTVINDQGITYLNGIDGLYFYKGSLIAIQDSGNQDDRIVRFYYDVKKGIITKVRTLQSFRKDFITPTTGTIIDDQFHYIANAQLRSLQPDGSLTNPEKLVKPVILKLKLD